MVAFAICNRPRPALGHEQNRFVGRQVEDVADPAERYIDAVEPFREFLGQLNPHCLNGGAQRALSPVEPVDLWPAQHHLTSRRR